MSTAKAIHDAFNSPKVPDSNLEPANVVDVIHQLAATTRMVALAIKPDAAPGRDANGGHVESLTESVMGVSQSLCSIAEAIRDLAQAVREHGGDA